MLNWIHRHMSVGARLILVCALLMVPLAIFATLFVSAKLEDIRFAERERLGGAYIAAAWPASSHSHEEQNAALQSLRAPLDAQFGTARAGDAFIGQSDTLARREAGAAFFGAIADASNLTLDPELDSFYAMDVVVVRLPELSRAAPASSA